MGNMCLPELTTGDWEKHIKAMEKSPETYIWDSGLQPNLASINCERSSDDWLQADLDI